MAKQRGTHQIAGTINNLVYYQQKYVKCGLIRRQNEAMPARLKEDPVFSNTRAANALFGGCMMLASALLRIGSRRLTVMTRPSRNAYLTASILHMHQYVYANSKDDTLNFEDYDAPAIIQATDRLMKTPVSRFFNSFSRQFTNLRVGSDIDIDFRGADLEWYALACGVSSVQIEFYGPYFIGPSGKDSTSGKFLAPEVAGSRVIYSYNWNHEDGDLPVTLTAYENAYARGFVFCTILPVISGAGMTARFKIENAIGFYLILDYQ